MVSLRQPSLCELCSIRIAYLMWTRHDVTKHCSKLSLFKDLFEIVLDDVQKFPLPDAVKSKVLPHVKPAGQHLSNLLNLWISKAQSKSVQKSLTSEMLSECLILNADGLINPRKTVEKLLACRMLDNEFAFRLACINYLETEVLKLWPIVKLHFLNKLMLESEQSISEKECLSCIRYTSVQEGNSSYYEVINSDIKPFENKILSSGFVCNTESHEVLFWMRFCLSKELGGKKLPHFIGSTEEWYKCSLKEATLYGNVAWFDYIMNDGIEKIDYNPLKMIESILIYEDDPSGFSDIDLKGFITPLRMIKSILRLEEDGDFEGFMFCYIRLDPEVKSELFRKFPRVVATFFLQWPLSLTFIEKTEEIWNFIRTEDKFCVFFKIISYIYISRRNSLCSRDSDIDLIRYTGIHSVEHLKYIWVTLWRISLDFHKSYIFEQLVFNNIREAVIRFFKTSGLEEYLLRIFLTNGGELILDLYEAENFRESLKNLIAKLAPEHSEDISLIGPQPLHFRIFGYSSPTKTLDRLRNQVDGKFINFIKSILYSSNCIDKAFFYS